MSTRTRPRPIGASSWQESLHTRARSGRSAARPRTACHASPNRAAQTVSPLNHGSGLTPATSAPGLTRATSAPELGSPPATCAPGLGSPPATSAPGLGLATCRPPPRATAPDGPVLRWAHWCVRPQRVRAPVCARVGLGDVYRRARVSSSEDSGGIDQRDGQDGGRGHMGRTGRRASSRR